MGGANVQQPGRGKGANSLPLDVSSAMKIAKPIPAKAGHHLGHSVACCTASRLAKSTLLSEANHRIAR